MFSVIDKKLITAAQWIINQIELFSNKLRHDVCNVVTQTIKGLHISWCFLIFMFFAIEPNPRYFLFAVLFFLFASPFIIKKYKDLVLLYKSQKSTEALPKEIWTRAPERVSHLVLLPTTTTIYITALNLEGDNPSIFVLSVVMHIILIFLILAFEYLLCTTSLPPGKKERRKQEKEMRSMKLQRISG